MVNWQFQFKDGESAANRFLRLFSELLAGGDLTDHDRSDVLRAFLACGHDPALSDGSNAIETVHTNCAMTQGAALHWCGGPNRPGPGHAGWPMEGYPGASWLGLLRHGPAWVPYDGTNTPEVPSIFFVQHHINLNNCHVGAFVAKLPDGSYKTAEGGGGNGSLVHYSKRTLGPLFDTYNGVHYRDLKGWWVVSKLGLPDVQPTVPVVTSDLVPGNTLAIQKALNKLGANPPLKEDGDRGPKTLAAIETFLVKALQDALDRLSSGNDPA